jgi:2,3-bisphosphoglycerate-independent phosphoglycerate mutase
MWTEKNGQRSPMVAHTLSPVPFIVKDFCNRNAIRLSQIPNPGLANVAATLCTLLGYAPPEGYEPSLVTVTGK